MPLLGPTWYTAHWVKIRWHSTVDRKDLGSKSMTAADSEQIWIWGRIHMKVDLISFPWSPRTPQSKSIWSRGSHHKFTLSSRPNPTLPKRVGLNFYLSCQSVIVAWWRTMGIHGTGPQSTSLILHAFHVCSIIFLIHICISKNDNESTSWRIINSSNVSNIIMIKNGFTFEFNVSNVIVSEKVMSSSSHQPVNNIFLL